MAYREALVSSKRAITSKARSRRHELLLSRESGGDAEDPSTEAQKAQARTGTRSVGSDRCSRPDAGWVGAHTQRRRRPADEDQRSDRRAAADDDTDAERAGAVGPERADAGWVTTPLPPRS